MPLYDLNIPWSPSTTREELDSLLRWAATLGYEVVALNHIIQTPLPRQIVNPLPVIPGPLRSTTTSSRTSTTNVPPQWPPIPFPKKILHRCTLLLSDPSQNYKLPQLAAAYDILALRPTTEKAFLAACTTVSDIAIISLDCTTRFGFWVKHKSAMTAVKRGVWFEVCYGHGVGGSAASPASGLPSISSGGGSASAGAQSLTFSNWSQIFQSTRGRGIIISSEARRKLTLRSPEAVRNLMSVWGLASEKGMEGVRDNPRMVVKNEGLKREGFRGVVGVLAVAERPAAVATGTPNASVGGAGSAAGSFAKEAAKPDGEKEDESSSVDSGAKTPKQTESSKLANGSSDTSKKRKASGSVTSSGDIPQQQQKPPPQQPMSKRAAKKKRLAIMKADGQTLNTEGSKLGTW